MGYYTSYSLEIVSGDDHTTDYESEIAKTTQYDRLFDHEIKWYNHENDMREFSKLYPDVLFCLHRHGEDNEDIWKCYFKNGKMFKAIGRIVYDDFSDDKLE